MSHYQQCAWSFDNLVKWYDNVQVKLNTEVYSSFASYLYQSGYYSYLIKVCFKETL